MSDNQDQLTNGEPGGKRRMISEEDIESRSSPAKDLLASGVILAFSVFAMVLSARLKNPGSLQTHPGLLPFLTGFTLSLMGLGLGLSALRKGGAEALWRAKAGVLPGLLGNEEARRALLLIAIIALYVLVADLVTFDLRYPTGLFVLRFSSFELVSIVALILILRFFWRAPLWRCSAVSVVFIILLASIFRYGFHILLPGAD